MAPIAVQLIAQLIDSGHAVAGGGGGPGGGGGNNLTGSELTDRPSDSELQAANSSQTSNLNLNPNSISNNSTDKLEDGVQLSGHLLLLFALLVLINLIVILGNILVIVAVHATVKLRSVTNIFIVSLATADLLLGLFVLPYALLYEVLDVWIFGRVWCRGWLVTDVWISTASILNLCAISIDRYVAVTRPVKYRSIMTARRAKGIVAAVWVVSFLICFPPLLPEWSPSSSPSSSPSLPFPTPAGQVDTSANSNLILPMPAAPNDATFEEPRQRSPRRRRQATTADYQRHSKHTEMKSSIFLVKQSNEVWNSLAKPATKINSIKAQAEAEGKHIDNGRQPQVPLKRVNCRLVVVVAHRDCNHCAERNSGDDLDSNNGANIDVNKRQNIYIQWPGESNDNQTTTDTTSATSLNCKTICVDRLALSSFGACWCRLGAAHVSVGGPARAGSGPEGARPVGSLSGRLFGGAGDEASGSQQQHAKSFKVNNNNPKEFEPNKTTTTTTTTITFTFIVSLATTTKTTTTTTATTTKTMMMTARTVGDSNGARSHSDMKQYQRAANRGSSSATGQPDGAGGSNSTDATRMPLVGHKEANQAPEDSPPPPSSELKGSRRPSGGAHQAKGCPQSSILDHFACLGGCLGCRLLDVVHNCRLPEEKEEEEEEKEMAARAEGERKRNSASKVGECSKLWAQIDSNESLNCGRERAREERRPPAQSVVDCCCCCCRCRRRGCTPSRQAEQILRFSIGLLTDNRNARNNVRQPEGCIECLYSSSLPTGQLGSCSCRRSNQCQWIKASQKDDNNSNQRPVDKDNHLKASELIIVCGEQHLAGQQNEQRDADEADLRSVDVTLNKFKANPRRPSEMDDNIDGRLNEFIVAGAAGSKAKGQPNDHDHDNNSETQDHKAPRGPHFNEAKIREGHFIIIMLSGQGDSCCHEGGQANNKEHGNHPPDQRAANSNEICLDSAASYVVAVAQGDLNSKDWRRKLQHDKLTSIKATSLLDVHFVSDSHYQRAIVLVGHQQRGANEYSSATNDHQQMPIHSGRGGPLFGATRVVVAAAAAAATAGSPVTDKTSPANNSGHLGRLRRNVEPLPAAPEKRANQDSGGRGGDNLNNTKPTKQQQQQQPTLECTLFHDKTYVIYSALGSFYIPMLFMVFFYSRIYLVASRAQKAMQRGYMTTKSWPSVQKKNNNKPSNNNNNNNNNNKSAVNSSTSGWNNDSHEAGAGPKRLGGARSLLANSSGPNSNNSSGQSGRWQPERVTLRIHRRTDPQQQHQHQPHHLNQKQLSLESGATTTTTTTNRTSETADQVAAWIPNILHDGQPSVKKGGQQTADCCLGADSILMKLTANEQQHSLANANLKKSRFSFENNHPPTSELKKKINEDPKKSIEDTKNQDDEQHLELNSKLANNKEPEAMDNNELANKSNGQEERGEHRHHDHRHLHHRQHHHHHHHHHHHKHKHHHHHHHDHHDHHQLHHKHNNNQHHHERHQHHKHDRESHHKCHHHSPRGHSSRSNGTETVETNHLESTTASAVMGPANRDDGDSMSSIQITISKFEEDDGQREGRADGDGQPNAPLLATSTPVANKSERSQSVGLVGADNNRGQLGTTTSLLLEGGGNENKRPTEPGEGDLCRAARSHSYGPMPTILVNWEPASGKYDARVAAAAPVEIKLPGQDQCASPRSVSALGSTSPRRPSSFTGSGLSLMANLPHQMRKQSMMLLSSLTTKSSQTLRRLSTAAAHPVDVLLKSNRHLGSRQSSSSFEGDEDNYESQFGTNNEERDGLPCDEVKSKSKKKKERAKERKRRRKLRKKSRLSSSGAGGGQQTKRTLDDYLMAVAGIDTSSGDDSGRDDVLGDELEEDDEDYESEDEDLENEMSDDDNESLSLSVMLTRENLLIPRITIAPGEDNRKLDKGGERQADAEHTLGQCNEMRRTEMAGCLGNVERGLVTRETTSAHRNINDELALNEGEAPATTNSSEFVATEINKQANKSSSSSNNNEDKNSKANVDESAALLLATDSSKTTTTTTTTTTTKGTTDTRLANNKGQQLAARLVSASSAPSAVWRLLKSSGGATNDAGGGDPGGVSCPANSEGAARGGGPVDPLEPEVCGPPLVSSTSGAKRAGNLPPWGGLHRQGGLYESATSRQCSELASCSSGVANAANTDKPANTSTVHFRVPLIKMTAGDDKAQVEATAATTTTAQVNSDDKFADSQSGAINQTATPTTRQTGNVAAGLVGNIIPGGDPSGGGGGGGQPRRRLGAKRTSRWHAKRLRAETKAAKTVAIIVGGFIFCWLPFFTAYLSRAIICDSPSCIPQSWLSLFIWLGYLNSAINPVIYGLFSADFRHAFKNIVCRCRLRAAGHDDTVVVSVLVDSIIKSIL